jgi:hypothetical protein
VPYEIPTRWPLVETVSTRNGTLLQDARLVNAIAEYDPQTKSYTVERRPSVVTSTISLIPDGSSQGLYSFDNSLIQLSGGNAYRGGLLLGPIATGPGTFGLYTFRATTSDADILMFAQPNNGYYFQGFFLRKITDTNYPGTIVPGITYLNGRFYVMDSAGRIYGAKNLDDPSTWDPLNVIVAQQRAGLGVYLAQQLSYILAIKSDSTELFWDSGQTATSDGTGSTLQPIPGNTIPYGCFDGGSFAEIDGTLLWMTSNLSGAPQVGRLDNLQFEIVSTPPVDRILRKASFGVTKAMTLKLGGHRYYVLQITGVSLNCTLIYDLDQKLWYVWTDSTGLSPWPYYNSASNQSSSPPLCFVQGSNGQAHILQEDYITPTDLGQTIPVDIYTPSYDADVDREKYMPALYFNQDMYQGSLVQVRWSDDDYQTWNTPQTVDFSQRKPMLTDLGSFYRRAFHIRHNAPTPFKIKSVGMTLGLGPL